MHVAVAASQSDCSLQSYEMTVLFVLCISSLANIAHNTSRLLPNPVKRIEAGMALPDYLLEKPN